MEKLAKNKSQSMRILNFNPDCFHILNVGLFTKDKNQGYVFDMARKLKGINIIQNNLKYLFESKNKYENVNTDRIANKLEAKSGLPVDKITGLYGFTQLTKSNPKC